MKMRFLRIKHPTSNAISLLVKIDPEPNGGFQIVDCAVTESAKPGYIVALLEKNGFDDAEVRLQIEQEMLKEEESII